MLSEVVRIGTRLVGPGQKVFIIAEAGVNHNGDIEIAERLVDAAVEAGADAVKFQTFRADALASRFAPLAEYQQQAQEADSTSDTQLEMLRGLEFTAEQFTHLQQYCLQHDIIFLSTPFDSESTDLLVSLGVPALKAGSGEVTNIPFLKELSSHGLPLILSTGMSTIEEVREAVAAVEVQGAPLILLHCTSNYPAAIEDLNLRAIPMLARETGLPIGYSDHSNNLSTPVAAVALGACVLEAHLTLDRGLSGPDHQASLDPAGFAEYVRLVREAETILGDEVKRPSKAELETARVARKSLVAARNMGAGDVLDGDSMLIKRPGTGIPPARLGDVVGRRLKQSLEEDEVITWSHLEAE